MGNCFRKKSFTWSKEEEPHRQRRKNILTAYPEIKSLFGPDIRLLPCILLLTLVQFRLSMMSYTNPFIFILSSWLLGGTISHILSLAVHELSHGLCFEDEFSNEVLGMVANCAQGIPSMMTFKKYHLEHHLKQGHDGFDVDIPTECETGLFSTMVGKLLFIILQPFFYAIRPLLLNPKPITKKEILNIVLVLISNTILYSYSPYALVYILLSDLLGLGLHPLSGHFIAEHYEFVSGQETYSYYGAANSITFNVGYHNEHHDFPRISGFRLPILTEMVPYYKMLPNHSSWTMVLWEFITNPTMGPFSRVKRNKRDKKKIEEN